MSSQQSKRLTAAEAIAGLEEIGRRMRIIEEHQLREQIEREEAIRRDRPDSWRRMEAERIARNRADSALNQKLGEAGCQPVAAELSLKQKMKKLQQLEARNRAESARWRVVR
jgi:hypothetical protein